MPGLKSRIRALFEPDGWDVPAEIKNCPKTPRELEELGLFRAFEELFDKLQLDIPESDKRLILGGNIKTFSK